jgi:hypothetical protein
MIDRMIGVLERADVRSRLRDKSVDLIGIRRIASRQNPVEALGYVARTFFDAELIVVPSAY